MPADEYATATGGSLKLKGVNPSSKVSKPHKKKKKPKAKKSSSNSNLEENTENGPDDPLKTVDGEPETVDEDALARAKAENQIEEDLEAEISARGRGKTEAELRHEERRRRRVGFLLLATIPNSSLCIPYTFLLLTSVQLDERLKREGTKTHKERVEELNRYLSNLSEHHDMYVLFSSKARYVLFDYILHDLQFAQALNAMNSPQIMSEERLIMRCRPRIGPG